MPQSQTQTINNNKIVITGIHAFYDNYIWAISSSGTSSSGNKSIALVDPGDAEVCINYLQKHDLVLNNILITHHHPDHTGGIARLKEYCAKNQWPVTVYGPKNENIPFCDVKLSEQENLNNNNNNNNSNNSNNSVYLKELNLTFQVLDLPGHTSGHIAYVNEEILFCGDTLFSGGCGRLFEGTAEQMHTSLKKLASLPGSTSVYCTHEYTQENLAFALSVEPGNKELVAYNAKVAELRASNIATVPSSIALEKTINPFLRCYQVEIKENAETQTKCNLNTELETFTAVRRLKDNF